MKRICVLAMFLVSGSLTLAAQCDTDINAVRESWQNNWNSGKLNDIAKLYAPDATLLALDGQRLIGRDNIKEYLDKLMKSGSVTFSIHSYAKAECSGDLAYENGTWDQTTAAAGATLSAGGSSQQQGNYLVVLKKAGNQWLIVQHASILKPPPK
jgi:uncharacterized protein (TIGR02246 family)